MNGADSSRSTEPVTAPFFLWGPAEILDHGSHSGAVRPRPPGPLHVGGGPFRMARGTYHPRVPVASIATAWVAVSTRFPTSRFLEVQSGSL